MTVVHSRRSTAAYALALLFGASGVLCLPATDDAGAAELLAQLATTHDASWSTGAAAVRNTDTLEAVLVRADSALYTNEQARREALAVHP
jgi:hypothetical protein